MKSFKTIATFVALALAVACGGDDDKNNDTGTTHKLTLNAGANGTLTADPAGPAYADGTVVTVTATPGSGFKVSAWTGTDDDTSLSPVNHVTMDADKTVSVTFTAVSSQTFTLTLNAGTNGTVAASPATGPYTDGTRVTLTATPAEGYEVDAWTGTDDDTSTTNTNAVTMTADKTVNVTFKVQPAQHTLTVTIDEQQASFEAGDWGYSVSPGNQTHLASQGAMATFSFDEGTTVTLTGIATAFWPVEGWKVDGGSLQAQCNVQIAMDTDHAATVQLPFDSAYATDNKCQ